MDSTSNKIILQIWQQQAENFIFKKNMHISITNSKIVSFFGKSITGGNLEINPSNDETIKLFDWFNQNKKKISFLTFSPSHPETTYFNFITIESVEKGNIYYFCKASLIDFKDLISYSACEKCLKKIWLSDNEFNCGTCKHLSKTCKSKRMLKILILDQTMDVWLTIFDSQIDQLTNNQHEQDISLFLETLKNQEFYFELKAKIYSRSQQKVLNYNCINIFYV